MNTDRALLHTEQLSEDVQKKLTLSMEETNGLALRDIRCPYCRFIVNRVFSDATGHYLARCRKCKREIVLNLAYFSRQKGIGSRKKIKKATAQYN